MKMYTKDKKARIERNLMDFIALAVVIVILLITSVIVLGKGGLPSRNIESINFPENIKSMSHYSVLEILNSKTPVLINSQEQEITFSELIRLADIDPRYNSILQEKLNQLNSEMKFSENQHQFTTPGSLRIKIENINPLDFNKSYNYQPYRSNPTLIPLPSLNRPTEAFLESAFFYIPGQKDKEVSFQSYFTLNLR